jgi:hypothetical protein
MTPGVADIPRKGWNSNSHGRLLDTWRGKSGRSTVTVQLEGASRSRITRISSEMRPVASTAGDIYAPHGGFQYQEEMVEGYDLRERARELEEYLRREGR